MTSCERKCIIRLRKYCVVHANLTEEEQEKYGTRDYVVTYCSMCIKALYAKAKMRLVKFSVVNTL